MLILYINQSAIYAISESESNNAPIRVFEDYYISFALERVTNFSAWLTRFIIPNNTDDLSVDEVKAIIKSTIEDSALLKRATLRLYPTQIPLIESNWKQIQEAVKKVHTDKTGRDFNIKDFDSLLATFKAHVKQVYHV